MDYLTAALLALAVCGCGEAVPAAQPLADRAAEVAADTALEVTVANPPTWSTSGRFVRDNQGRAVVLHGINVSSAAKYDPLHVGEANAATFAKIAGLGFDSVRLLTFWGAVMVAPPGADVGELAADQAYLARLDKMVAEASAAGLLVVLDMHQDLFGFGFGDNGAPPAACAVEHYQAYTPTDPWYFNYLNPHVQACFDGLYAPGPVRDAWVTAWRLLAKRYRGDPRIVGFDLLNEPHNGSAGTSSFIVNRLFPFYRAAVDAIRAEDPERLVFVEPITTMLLSESVAVEPFGRMGAVWAPHYYHFLVHDGQPYDPATAALLVEQPIDRLAGAAATVAGPPTVMPAWFGEFGTPEVAGDDLLIGQVVQRFDQHLASWCYWSWDRGGFSPMRGDGSLRVPLLRALLRPHPRRVAGELLEMNWQAGPRRLTVRYRTTLADTAPTLVWPGIEAVGLPLSATPSTVTVTSTDPLGSWSWHRQGDLIRIVHATAAVDHTVSVELAGP